MQSSDPNAIPGVTAPAAPAALPSTGLLAPPPAADQGPGKPAAPTAALPTPPSAPASKLDYFSQYVATSGRGESPDMAKAQLFMASHTLKMPVTFSPREEVEPAYRRFVTSQGGKWDSAAQKGFNDLYRKAELDYADYEQGRFNTANLRSSRQDSAFNEKLGIQTRVQNNTTRSDPNRRASDMAGGQQRPSNRAWRDVYDEAINGDGVIRDHTMVQTERFENTVQDQFNDSKLGANYNSLTKTGAKNHLGLPELSKQEPLEFGDGLKMGSQDGVPYPIVVRAHDDAFGATGLLSQHRYKIESDNTALDSFIRLGTGIGSAAYRIGGTVVNARTRTDDYMNNLQDFFGKTSFTDRLLGKGYESRDSELARQLIVSGQQLAMPTALDQQGSAFDSKKAFVVGVTNVVAQMLPQVGLAFASGGASVAYSTLDGYSSVYTDYRQQGYTNAEANVAGILAGVVTAASTKFLEGPYLSKLIRGNKAIVDDMLIKFSREATKDVLAEAAREGIELTGEAMTAKLASRTGQMLAGVTNQLQTLEKRLAGSKLGGFGKTVAGLPESIANFAENLPGGAVGRGVGAFIANGEGAQEVVEGIGQLGIDTAFQKLAWNGKLYDLAGIDAPERKDEELEQMKQRQKELTWSSFLAEQAESFVLGQIGGGVAELPVAMQARKKHQEKEINEALNGIVTYFAENKGQNMDALSEKTRAIGAEGRWGLNLSQSFTTPKDGQPTNNDYVTQSMLNQIELVKRVGRDSGILEKLKLGSIGVQQAVGALSQLVSQADLHEQGMRRLVQVEGARQQRDKLYEGLVGEEALATAPAAGATPSTAAAATYALGLAEWKAEVARRQGQRQPTGDAAADKKTAETEDARYKRGEDKNAEGTIARYGEVAAYYEAAKLEREKRFELERSDASDVAKGDAIEAELAQARAAREIAFKAMEPLLTTPEVSRVHALAEAQLAVDEAAIRARDVYDGTLVRDVTQESFLRHYYEEKISQLSNPEELKKLTLPEQQRLATVVAALQAGQNNFFKIDPSGKMVTNGADLRGLNFRRKRRLAQAAVAEQQQQLAAQEVAEDIASDLESLRIGVERASNDPNQLDPATGSALLIGAQRMLAGLPGGSLNVSQDDVDDYADALNGWVTRRRQQLETDEAARPENSRAAWEAAMTPDERANYDSQLPDVQDDLYNDFIGEKKQLLKDGTIADVNAVIDQLRNTSVVEYATAATTPALAFEVSLGTTLDALAPIAANQPGGNALDNLLTGLERKAADSAIGDLKPETFEELQRDITRNLVLADLNKHVNNLLYTRSNGQATPATAATAPGQARKGWFERAKEIGQQAADRIAEKAAELEEESLVMDPTLAALSPDHVRRTTLRRTHLHIAKVLSARWVAEQAKAAGVSGLALTLGKLAQEMKMPVWLQLMARASGGAGQANATKPLNFVAPFAAIREWLRERAQSFVTKAATEAAWASPYGPTGDLRHQSEEAYGQIVSKSQAQLLRLQAIIAQWQDAQAQRATVDLKSRHNYLATEAQRLREHITGSTVFANDPANQQLLADADAKLDELLGLQVAVRADIEPLQTLLHEAEEILRQAFADPVHRTALVLEKHHEALKITGQQFSAEPERHQAEALRIMYTTEGYAVSNLMSTLAALFGPSRVEVSGHYAEWLRANIPKHDSGQEPIPSFEQEQLVIQAVQHVRVPWLFPDNHPVSVMRKAQLDDTLLGVGGDADNVRSTYNIGERMVFVQGFAGAGKTHMVAAPLVGVLAALNGANPNAPAGVRAVAQHPGQREGIESGLLRAGTLAKVSGSDVDALLAELSTGTLAGIAVLAIDEVTILTTTQSAALVLGIARLNANRRQNGEVELQTVLLGDPAQLVGEELDSSTNTLRRATKDHPLAYDNTVLMPRLTPLVQPYRSGYIVHDELQKELRYRILSPNGSERTDISPVSVSYSVGVPGNHLTLAGAQYQNANEQRQQYLTHIRQLESAGGTQTLRIVVSTDGLQAELDFLALNGIQNPERYVVQVDKAQGSNADFVYVHVNELDDQGDTAGNSTLRALLVGVTRTKQYVSVRTAFTPDNKQESRLSQFSSDSSDAKRAERKDSNLERMALTDALAALPNAGVNGITPVPAQHAGPTGNAPMQAPGGNPVPNPMTTAQAQAGQAQATATSIGTLVSIDPTANQSSTLPTVATDAAADAADAAAAAAEAEQEQLKKADELRQRWHGVRTTGEDALLTITPVGQTKQGGEDTTVDPADVFAEEEELSQNRYSALMNAKDYRLQLVDLLNEAVALGNDALTAELQTALAAAGRLIEAEQVRTQRLVAGIIAVPDEISAGAQGVDLNAVDVTQPHPPVLEVESAMVEGQMRPVAIHKLTPTYDHLGNFQGMVRSTPWTAEAGESYMAQLRQAQAELRREIVAEQAKLREFSNNRVATLADEGKVILHTFGIDGRAGDVLAQQQNKAGWLNKVFALASKLTRQGPAGKKLPLEAGRFKKMRMADGTVLEGEGEFRIVYHATYPHALQMQEDLNGDYHKNVFEIQYVETVPGNSKPQVIGLGVLRQEHNASPGNVRKLGTAQNPLDALLADVRRLGTYPVGKTLPLADVQAPHFYQGTGSRHGEMRNLPDFRARMKEMGVAVSSPFVITVRSSDDFKAGSVSYALGEIEAETQGAKEGGKKMLSGRACVFTSFGGDLTPGQVDTIVREVVARGGDGKLSAMQVIAILRDDYDLEMVLMNQKVLKLSDYVSGVLGKAGVAFNTKAQLAKFMGSELVNGRLNYRGKAAGQSPVRLNLTSQRSLLSSVQARVLDAKADSLPLNRRGVINKMFALLTDGEFGPFQVGAGLDAILTQITNNGGKYNASTLARIKKELPYSDAFFTSGLLDEKQMAHLQHLLALLATDTTRNTTRDSLKENPLYNAKWAPDLLLYLGYLDNVTDGKFAVAWDSDGNDVQLNPSFGADVRTNTFTPMGTPPGVDIEDLLETDRDTKTYPSFLVDFADIAARKASGQAQAAAPTTPAPTPRPAAATPAPPPSPAPAPVAPAAAPLPVLNTADLTGLDFNTPTPAAAPVAKPTAAPAAATTAPTAAPDPLPVVVVADTPGTFMAALRETPLFNPADTKHALDPNNSALPVQPLRLIPSGDRAQLIPNPGVGYNPDNLTGYKIYFETGGIEDGKVVQAVRVTKPAVLALENGVWKLAEKGKLAYDYSDGTYSEGQRFRTFEKMRAIQAANAAAKAAATGAAAAPATSAPAPGPNLSVDEVMGMPSVQGKLSRNFDGSANGTIDREEVTSQIEQVLGDGGLWARLLGRAKAAFTFEGRLPFTYAYAAVINGLIEMNAGANGLYEALSPRHEALHYVLQLMTPAQAAAILHNARMTMLDRGYAGAMSLSDLEVEEWLADHYAQLFRFGDRSATKRAQKWGWMPSSVLRFFFDIRDAFRTASSGPLQDLQRTLDDIESGRYRDLRVAPDAGHADRHSQNEVGRRTTAYQAMAGPFGGLPMLDAAADWVTGMVFKMQFPVMSRDGRYLPDPVEQADAMKAVVEKIKYLRAVSLERGEVPNPDSSDVIDGDPRDGSPLQRSWAQFFLATMQVQYPSSDESGALSPKVPTLVLNAIFQKRFAHVRGQVKVTYDKTTDTVDAEVDGNARSAVASIYPADNGPAPVVSDDQGGDDDDAATQATADEESSTSAEAADLSYDNQTLGASHYLEDKNKQADEGAELLHHLANVPLLQRQINGTYTASGRTIDVRVGKQLLRDAGARAKLLAAAAGRDVPTYADMALGLQHLSQGSTSVRHDVVTSILARFFNHSRVAMDDQVTAMPDSRLLSDTALSPAGNLTPSYFELAFPNETLQPTLAGNGHAEYAGRVLSQIHCFYVSLEKRDLMDAEMDGGVRETGKVANRRDQLKNQANSSIVAALYTKNGNSVLVNNHVLQVLGNKGFRFALNPTTGRPMIQRKYDDGSPAGVLVTLIEFDKPQQVAKSSDMQHRGYRNTVATNDKLEFYAESIYELLGAMGLRSIASHEAIKQLAMETSKVPGEGRNGFNNQVADWIAKYYGQVLYEQIDASQTSARKPGKAYLQQLFKRTVAPGQAPDAAADAAHEAGLRTWFTNPVFAGLKDDLNKIYNRGAETQLNVNSPTRYLEVTQKLVELISAVTVEPETLYGYNENGDKVYLLQHGNALYRSMRRIQSWVQQGVPAWLSSEGYDNPVASAKVTVGAPLLYGTIGSKKTGRKHALVDASPREVAKLAFEKLFVGQLLQGLNGKGDQKMQRAIFLGTPKADKATQFGHPVTSTSEETSLFLVPGTDEAAAALTNLHASYQSMFRHQVLPRFAAAGVTLPARVKLKAQVGYLNAQLQTRSAQEWQKAGLQVGVDFTVDKTGTVTGMGNQFQKLLLMPVADFVAQVEASLDFEAGKLHAQGYYSFESSLREQLSAAGLVVDGANLFTKDGSSHDRVRKENPLTGTYEYNPLIKAFLLSKLVYSHHIETALVGPGIYFKDETDYAKRYIMATTNYQAYDLNARGGLPPVSRLAVMRDEFLSDVLGMDEVDSDEEKGRGNTLDTRYGYTDAADNWHHHATASADNGQFFGVMAGMAPNAKWAKDLIYGQALHDGLGTMTLLHDIQSQASYGNDWRDPYDSRILGGDQSQRKLINGGMQPDGSPMLAKNSYARLTNELLELGNEYTWSQLIKQLGGTASPIYKQWIAIREQLEKEITDPVEFRRVVTRGNADWVMLHEWYTALDPQTRADYDEHLHKGLSSMYSGVKVGARGHNNVLDDTYESIAHDNQNGGMVTNLNQNLDEADIANISQETYIFSLQGENWRTTDEVMSYLGKLSREGLIDLDQLLTDFGGKEMFMRKAAEMLSNLGNAGNTYSMMVAGVDPNLPLVRNPIASAIASAIKSKTTKQRLKGARLTVQCSSGRVNMYVTPDGRRLTKRDVLRDGLATVNAKGELVPTSPDAFAVSELAFTRLQRKATDTEPARLATKEEALALATALHQRNPAAAELAALYDVLPMEVMAPRGLFKEFMEKRDARGRVISPGIPAHLDVSDVTPELFADIVRQRRAQALNDGKLRKLMAEAEISALEAELNPTVDALNNMQVGDDTVPNDAAEAYEISEEDAYLAEQRKLMVDETAAGYSQLDLMVEREMRVSNDDSVLSDAKQMWDNWNQALTIKATRIPVTGPNSVQAGRIVSFYDSQSNTILLPSHVQTVAGADNDGDMVTVELHSVRAGGLSYLPPAEGERPSSGYIKNSLRASKMQFLQDSGNIVQLFRPIDFANLKVLQKNALALQQRLAGISAEEEAAGWGPLGKFYRHVSGVESMVKNQQGKSGVGPFIKLAELYYKNIAMIRALQASGSDLGDLRDEIAYGPYRTSTVGYDEVSTSRSMENLANASLDNAKEGILGILNVNPQMWNVVSGMMWAQIPETEIYRLISHPYALKVTALAQRSQDVDQYKKQTVADVTKRLLLADPYQNGYDDEGLEELIAKGGFGYEQLRNATAVKQREVLVEKLKERGDQLNEEALLRQAKFNELEKLAATAKRLAKGSDEDSKAQKAADVAARQLARALKAKDAAWDKVYKSIDRVDAKSEALGNAETGESPDLARLAKESLRALVEAQQQNYTGIPDGAQGPGSGLEGVNSANPREESVDPEDFAVKKFIYENLYLFALRGDELLEAQGVLRATDGPPATDAQSMSVMKRVLSGLGYGGSIEEGIELLETELLAGESGPDSEGNANRVDTEADLAHRISNAEKKGGNLINPALHVATNPALRHAIRALVLDFKQRQELFLVRQPMVQASFERIMDAGSFALRSLKGRATMAREFGRWIDARFFADPRYSRMPRVPAELLAEGHPAAPYLSDLQGVDFSTLVGQVQFLNRTAAYLGSLKARAADGYGGRFMDSALIANLQTTANEHGPIVELANAANLSSEEKAMFEGHFRRLDKRFGAEGRAIQEILFRYALLTKGLMPGRGSLAEVVSPDVVQGYSSFLGEQQLWFGGKQFAAGRIPAELADFEHAFLRANPEFAREFHKPSSDLDQSRQSYYFDKDLPAVLTPKMIRRGSSRFQVQKLAPGKDKTSDQSFRETEGLPPVVYLAHAASPGQRMPYQLVLVSKADHKLDPANKSSAFEPYYVPMHRIGPPQLATYTAGSYSMVPLLQLTVDEQGQSLKELLNDASAPATKKVLAHIEKLRPVLGVQPLEIAVRSGETYMVPRKFGCTSA